MLFEREGLVKIQWDSPHMLNMLPHVEHMGLNIWCTLDWIIVFCHKSAEIIFELDGFKFI